ncbi:hypothetical protein CATRI_02465 [Corynebacterium atrinae]|nr:hypothetical protein CATRI_02465 [Corynebacterium atrinae]
MGAEELAGLSRGERIELLRSRMGAPKLVPTALLGVPSELGRLLPQGGLARRAVTEIADCPALVVELISHATATGGHVGVVGWPELSLAGVSEQGNLERVIVVPDPGVDPLEVAAVLVEGLDLVIVHSTGQLSPARARPLLAKLREGSAALVFVGLQVASPAARIGATVSTFRGIGLGRGRIQGLDIHVEVEAKGHRPTRGTMTVGRRAELRAV